jgi:glutathione S-transferase
MPVQRPILYSFRRCPYAIRARLALLQAGLVVELREVDLKRKPAELLALSPAATVPVLDLGGGEVLTQSLDIVHWAFGQHDPDGWLTRGDAARDAHLIALTDGEFKQALDRTKYPERFAGQNTEQNADRSANASRATAERCLIAPLEAALASSAYLGGNTPNWADASVFPFVRQFAAIDAARWAAAPWPATQRWLAHWQSNPLLATCMVKAAVWQPGRAGPHWPP